MYQLQLIFRRIVRNKFFVFINLLGLALSLAIVLLLSYYYNYENNVDGFHENKDQIYRVLHDNGCYFSPPFGQYIVNNISGIEDYTRTFEMDAVLKYKATKIRTKNCLFVDSSFFNMFSFDIRQGQPFKDKMSILVSESFAYNLFGSQDIIGKQVTYNNRLTFTVTGIFSDFGKNTHFNSPDVIFNYLSFDDVWGFDFLSSLDIKYFLGGLYVQAHPQADMKQKAEKLAEMVRPWYWLFQEDRNDNIYFQKLEDVYFNPSEYGYSSGARQGNKRILNTLMLIAIFISFLAAINYTNLSVSLSLKQFKTIGIKKIFGAGKVNIVLNSLFETFIICLAALLLSYVIVVALFPYFNNIVGYNNNAEDFFTVKRILGSATFILVLAILAGIIPALINARYSPLKLISGGHKIANLKVFQKGLVIFQFMVSIVLVVFMLFQLKQNQYLLSYDLGFAHEKMMYIRLNSDFKQTKEAFRNEIGKIPGVEDVSLTSSMPGKGINKMSFKKNGKVLQFDVFWVEEDFFKILGLKAKPARNTNDFNSWLNESAAKLLNISEKDDYYTLEGSNGEFTSYINDIVPDMHFHPLYQQPAPTIFMPTDTDNWVEYLLIGYNTSDKNELLTQLEGVFKEFSSNFPFEYAFIDDSMNKAYDKEGRISDILVYLTFFALIISSIGIFALALYSSQQRIKEIAIRKVCGSKTLSIISLLVKDFIKWVVYAYLLALPIAIWASNKWLENFPYRISNNWSIYAITLILVMGVAFITVGFQCWISARKNPADSIRYE
jgi:putative ABC transport system permease protein